MTTTDQWLSDDELYKLTARKMPCKQREALDGMGIPYRHRWDGKNIVLRSALTEEQPKPKKSTAKLPDMSAI